MTPRKGKVLYKGQLAGIVEETPEGYRFTYDLSWLASADTRPISVTLPIREAPFDSPVLHPFFDGLIPEGWLLDVVVRSWKVDARDRMGLLLTVCRDCIGAVSVEAIDD